MEIFVLDSDFETVSIVESFTSFIWKERWNQYGDFQLKIPYGHVQGNRLWVGNYLQIPQSDTLMKIERYEKMSQSKEDLVTVSGRSIITALMDKVSNGYTTHRQAPNVAMGLVHHTCVLGNGRSQQDVVPNLRVGDTAQFGDWIEYDEGPVVIYDEMKRLADEYDFGFRMRFLPDTKQFLFGVIRGRDLTDDLVFSPDLGNLTDVSYLRTIENFRNVAYVYHRDMPNMHIVYRRGHEYVSGLDRRVLLVDASSIREPREWQLRRAGLDALKEHGFVGIVDGEVIPGLIRKGRDFRVGDYVQIEDERGRVNTSRVTEYIWSYDQEGEREFPSFTADD